MTDDQQPWRTVPPPGRPQVGRVRYDPTATERGRTAPQRRTPSGAAPPQAVYAMAAALASWVLLPIIGAIISLRFAGSAAREIENSGGEMDGARMVGAARVIAVLNILFWLTLLSILLGPRVVMLTH